MINKRL